MTNNISKLPPIDILFYGHDGRGLGHISRSVAIGLAASRLFPNLQLLLITGGQQTQEMIGSGGLDWLKLPAYQTEVIDGKSRGIDGKSGYRDQELGILRAEQLRQIMRMYRPRIVLADHSPQGKHKELRPSLEDPEIRKQTRWFLGMRGVVGTVKQTNSNLARDLFKRYYSGLLWYGDSEILGSSHYFDLQNQFATEVVECGYVSRFKESEYLIDELGQEKSQFCSTISVPWVGEYTGRFLELLASFLETEGENHGKFKLYLGDDVSKMARKNFQRLECCSVEPFGSSYIDSLRSSRTAVIFGGYNSLMDVLALNIPALVIVRNMQDEEQQVHLEALAERQAGLLTIEEQDGVNDPARLAENLSALFAANNTKSLRSAVDLSGAETAARFLAASLGDQR